MNTQLQTFQNNALTADIRCAIHDGNVWFVAGDMAKALDYTRTDAMLQHCDESAVLPQLNKINNLAPATKWINESDLYNCIFGSIKPEAKVFKKWVTSEVLPAIRKTGIYSVQPQLPTSYIEALQLLIESEKEKQAAIEKIEADRPKVEFANIITEDSNTRCLRVWIKAMKHENNLVAGERQVFKFLVEHKYIYIYSQGTGYLPYARYEAGGLNYFTVVIDDINGKPRRQLKITGKGVVALTSKVVNYFGKTRCLVDMEGTA